MADIFDLIVNAIATGFGVALGTYVANQHFIKKLEKFMDRLVKARK